MIHNIPEPKWDKPPVNIRKISMEDKLLSLKEQFCNFYCPNKGKVIDYECSGIVECNECEEIIECEKVQEIYVDLCDECNISDYISFIRDEL